MGSPYATLDLCSVSYSLPVGSGAEPQPKIDLVPF